MQRLLRRVAPSGARTWRRISAFTRPQLLSARQIQRFTALPVRRLHATATNSAASSASNSANANRTSSNTSNSQQSHSHSGTDSSTILPFWTTGRRVAAAGAGLVVLTAVGLSSDKWKSAKAESKQQQQRSARTEEAATATATAAAATSKPVEDEKDFSARFWRKFDQIVPFGRMYRYCRTLLIGEEKSLLPPEMPDPYGARPRTLVLGFERTLVHSVWTRDEGWRTRKRPGLDAFMNRMYELGYELVIWSDHSINDHEPIVNDLDPDMRVATKLYREHTNWRSFHTFKNLDRMQRDLKRVVVLDATADSTNHPKNALHLPPWTGDLNDNHLERLRGFFERVKDFNIPDVRPYIDSYNANKSMADIFAEEEKAAKEVGAQSKLRKDDRNSGWGGLLSNSGGGGK